MPAKKMRVLQNSTMHNCIGCDVLVQRDETNEQNINFFRQEMAERWRLQEKLNESLQAGIAGLTASIGEYLKALHKLEKSVIYAALTSIVMALVTIASRFIK